MTDLKMCVAELVKEWENDVSDSTLKTGFAKTGFGVIPEIEEKDLFLQIQKSWQNLHSKGYVTDSIHLNKFLTVDDKLIFSDYPTDEEILSSFLEIEEPKEVN